MIDPATAQPVIRVTAMPADANANGDIFGVVDVPDGHGRRAGRGAWAETIRLQAG